MATPLLIRKLRVMANQTASPSEAAVAREKLAALRTPLEEGELDADAIFAVDDSRFGPSETEVTKDWVYPLRRGRRR